MLFKKVDATSPEAVTSALDFFTTPPTNCAISNSNYREYLTLNPISSKPFNFKIHPINSLIDLSKVYLHVNFRIERITENGIVVPEILDMDNVSTIQMPAATFIKNLKVLINQREIYDSNSLYSYKAFLDAELNYPKSVKDSYFSVAGYFSETDPNKINSTRKNQFEGKNQVVQYITKLDADLFNQDLYLISNVEVDIEIMPQSDSFMLMYKNTEPPNLAPNADQKTAADHQLKSSIAKSEYRLVVNDIRLMVKTVDLMEGLSLDIARKLDSTPARYPIRKTDMKSLFITQGRYDFAANLFMEEVPRRVMIGLVPNENFIGHKEKSPFYFNHANVRSIELTASGRTFPNYPYDLDYSQNRYARAFHDQQEHLGFAYSNESNGISYSNFKTAFCIYIFSLNNSQKDNPGFELIKDGSVTVQIRFSSAVPAGGFTLIAYAEYDGMLMIDRNRVITSDLTV